MGAPVTDLPSMAVQTSLRPPKKAKHPHYPSSNATRTIKKGANAAVNMRVCGTIQQPLSWGSVLLVQSHQISPGWQVSLAIR